MYELMRMADRHTMSTERSWIQFVIYTFLQRLFGIALSIDTMYVDLATPVHHQDLFDKKKEQKYLTLTPFFFLYSYGFYKLNEHMWMYIMKLYVVDIAAVET